MQAQNIQLSSVAVTAIKQCLPNKCVCAVLYWTEVINDAPSKDCPCDSKLSPVSSMDSHLCYLMLFHSTSNEVTYRGQHYIWTPCPITLSWVFHSDAAS